MKPHQKVLLRLQAMKAKLQDKLNKFKLDKVKKLIMYVLLIIILFIVWGFFNVYRESERAICYVHFKDQTDVGKACDGAFSVKNIIFNFGQWR